MRKLLLLIFFPVTVVSQNTIGLPSSINYSRQAYGGGLQNWDVAQDKNGLIYIANNEGLLSFDGKNWLLYPLPNRTIVHSIATGDNYRIYVGGQDELGYFEPGLNGRLQYHSLVDLLPAADRSFGDVWDIAFFEGQVFFRSPLSIFRFTKNKVAVYRAASEWAFMGACNNKLYAHDYRRGLLQLTNDEWKPTALKSTLPLNDAVTALLPLTKDSIFIATLKNGLFIFHENKIAKLPFANSPLFENERIYSATQINNEWLALATNNGGVYIIDHKGAIIQRFSKAEGLQNNNVLSVFSDNQSNLWLGLDTGIDFIAYNSAIKNINPPFQDGSGYAATIFKNRLYIGTSNGLFSVVLQPINDLSFSKGTFEWVTGTKGQAWSLQQINNRLYLGHHDGAFLIKENEAVNIAATPGYWKFLPVPNATNATGMLAGTYKGITYYPLAETGPGAGVDKPEFSETSRFVALDKTGNIWVSHPYHGVYKIKEGVNGSSSTTIYTKKKGLPSTLNNHIYKIKNEVVAATENGVYEYIPSADRFAPSAYYHKLIGNQSIRYLQEDAAGNIWFISERKLGVIDFTGKAPAVIMIPELTGKMLSGFEIIYPFNEHNIFLGGEKGFFHINYTKYKKNSIPLQIQIRSVRIISKTDSLLFGGYFAGVNSQQVQNASGIPQINFKWKTIRFEYSSPVFGNQNNLEYSFRLQGFENNWSGWIKRTDKEFTNLPPGDYQFEVKVRSNLGNESAPSVYAFTINAPWYLTTTAKIGYLLLALAIVYGIYKWQHRKFKIQQAKHEEEQKRLLYIHELERAKTASELITLRNEKLEAEINFKNSELASSAMHLVKKGELLSKIKGELGQVMKSVENPQTTGELKKMIKTVSEDDKMDMEWEKFSKHFDRVHGDFIVALKEKHPTVTPNELKLSAYLRMNLSTKEIAQLMNISVRGVEISRYRLRKKLQISSSINLFDYLINI